MELPAVTSPGHQPATFAERGVYLPGTTPSLAGTRVRRGADGLEFVIPNPANGRGVYVLRWSAVRDTMQPTLHDVLLHNALRAAAAITPATVRAAARQVALDGAAGREARASALRLGEADVQAWDRTSRHILSSPGMQGVTLAGVLVDTLTALGVGPEASTARLPLLLVQLQGLRDAVRAVADQHGDEGALAVVAAASDLALDGGSVLLAVARRQAQDIGTLLAAYSATPGSPALAVNRPGWFLDGWELPCLLWQQAGTLAAQRAAAAEICCLLPVLPAEAANWIGRPVTPLCWVDIRRAMGNDWRVGLAALDRQERNERMRALVA